MSWSEDYYIKNRKRILKQVSLYNQTHFEKRKEYRQKYYLLNKEKLKIYSKNYHSNPKRKKRDSYLNKWKLIFVRYGLTKQKYFELIKKGQSKCYNEFCPTKKNLRVDHNHQTNKIRGMLCIGCNTALGSLKENKNTILGLARYLEKYN